MKQHELLTLLSCCLGLVACSETIAPVLSPVSAPFSAIAVPAASVPTVKTKARITASPKPAGKKDSASKAVKKAPTQETLQKTERVLSVEPIVS